MPGPLVVLLVMSMVGLVWAIVALGGEGAGGDPQRRQRWRIASVVALVFVVALAGGMAVGQDLF